MPIQHQDDRPSPAPQECEENALSLREVSFSYPDGHRAVKSVSLDIDLCEKVALVGPNGAGKSTLMLQLNGIYRGKGQIEVMGMPVQEDNLPLVRSRIGMVFQNPDDQLFSPTVFEDVAFGPLHMGLDEDEIKVRVDEALEKVGMTEYTDRLSYHLSLGEKKRIAIATVLSMHPDILVFDEPTGGLDPPARRSLINLLGEMDLTMFVSSHDMRFVKEIFPRMVIMDQGRVVADGPTRDLLADPDLLQTHGLEQP